MGDSTYRPLNPETLEARRAALISDIALKYEAMWLRCALRADACVYFTRAIEEYVARSAQ